MVQENESRPLGPESPARRVLESIPSEGAIGYIELRDRTGLAGETLGDALQALQDLGLIGAKQNVAEPFYWKVIQQPGKEPGKVWYTLDEAAGHMSVSKRTVQHLIKDGQLPAYRVGRGGHRRIKSEDLDSAMHRDDVFDITAMTAREDPVLAELWDNDQDSVYDQL